MLLFYGGRVLVLGATISGDEKVLLRFIMYGNRPISCWVGETSDAIRYSPRIWKIYEIIQGKQFFDICTYMRGFLMSSRWVHATNKPPTSLPKKGDGVILLGMQRSRERLLHVYILCWRSAKIPLRPRRKYFTDELRGLSVGM